RLTRWWLFFLRISQFFLRELNFRTGWTFWTAHPKRFSHWAATNTTYLGNWFQCPKSFTRIVMYLHVRSTSTIHEVVTSLLYSFCRGKTAASYCLPASCHWRDY